MLSLPWENKMANEKCFFLQKANEKQINFIKPIRKYQSTFIWQKRTGWLESITTGQENEKRGKEEQESRSWAV